MNRRALLTGLAASTTLLLPPILIPATPFGPPPYKYFFDDLPTALAKFESMFDRVYQPGVFPASATYCTNWEGLGALPSLPYTTHQVGHCGDPAVMDPVIITSWFNSVMLHAEGSGFEELYWRWKPSIERHTDFATKQTYSAIYSRLAIYGDTNVRWAKAHDATSDWNYNLSDFRKAEGEPMRVV